MCNNTIAPIIVILDYLEVDIEVSDIDVKTAEFNDCGEMLGDNKGANSMLVAM